jgi:phosphoribosylformylglycinamidine cyclo-ligase
VDAVVDRLAIDGASPDGFGTGPAWDVPPVISYVVRAAGLTPDEAYKTFNMGVGMCVLCAPEDVDEVRTILAEQGLASFVMGECVPGTGEVQYR